MLIVATRISSCISMMMVCQSIAVVVRFDNADGWHGTQMSLAARCLDRRGKPLNGKRGHQQPKQQCLEDAIHEISLAQHHFCQID